MIKSFVFADLYSGHEVLTFISDDEVFGLIYNPRMATPPLAWKKGCSHCLKGKQPLDLYLKRHIQTLCSLDSVKSGYRLMVPSNSSPFYVTCKNKFRIVEISKSTDGDPIAVAKVVKGHLIFSSGRAGDFSSGVISRSLRFLSSIRLPTTHEIIGCVSSVGSQNPTRRYPCFKIDWASTLNGKIKV